MVVYFQSEINRKFKDSKKSLNRGRYAHQTAKRGDSREHENSCNYPFTKTSRTICRRYPHRACCGS